MSVYREGADPRRIEELHSLDVSTSKGAHTVGILLGVSLVFAVAWAVTLFAGAPPEVEGWVWTMPVAAAIFGAPAYLLHRRRARRLRIVRHGDRLRLLVGGSELDFPLECHGSQYETRVNRMPMYEVFFQLVDRKANRGVLLHQTRGTIHGPIRAWFPDDVDRSIASESFDVSGAGTLAEVHDWVERRNKEANPRHGSGSSS